MGVSTARMPLPDSAMDGGASRCETLWQWLTPGSIITIGVISVLVVDALLHNSVANIPQVSALLLLFVLAWSIAFRVRTRFPRTASFIRHLWPLVLYPVLYGVIHGMITAARPSDTHLVDAALYRFDVALFSVNPIAWLGEHAQPLLTDALYLSYFSYYVGMPVLLILMWRGNRAEDFQRVATVMIAGWYGALISYALFPALGPSRWMPGELPVLHGLLPSTAWIQTFLTVNLQPEVRDCVPSMHSAITLLTLVYAYRYQRRFFHFYLAPGLGIILATMYIQAHYVVDVLLGILTAGVLYLAAERGWLYCAGRSSDASRVASL